MLSKRRSLRRIRRLRQSVSQTIRKSPLSVLGEQGFSYYKYRAFDFVDFTQDPFSKSLVDKRMNSGNNNNSGPSGGRNNNSGPNAVHPTQGQVMVVLFLH